MGAGGRYKLRIHGVGRAGTSTVFLQAVFALCDSTKTLRCLVPASRAERFKNEKQTREKTMKIRRGPKMQYILLFFGQHRTIPALRLKHRSGSLFPPLAALTFAASSIICAFGLAAAAPRSPYRHLELCGIALKIKSVLPEWHSARSCHSASAAGYRHPAQHSRWRRSGAKMPSGRHRTERRTGPHTRSDSARCKGATA